MIGKFVETVVGGAIGLVALYIVGKVAYTVGHEMAEAEQRYVALTDKEEKSSVEEPTAECVDVERQPERESRKAGKFGVLMGIKNALGGKSSVMGELVNRPEDHKLEAYISEGEVHIDIKKRKRRGGVI